MSMQDPIADMFTRIRNAQAARHAEVSMPFSTIKEAIAKVLIEEGYIVDYRIDNIADSANKRLLVIDLKYFNNKPVIEFIQRASKPGLRLYKAAEDMPEVMDKMGIAIVTTSRGVMTGRSAVAAGHGGEILGYVA
jgi:small subunit ribosomal protein S8